MENVKIVINEKDTTSPVGGNSISSDIVFVPGLTGYDNTIRLFTKLSDFKYGVYCTKTTYKKELQDTDNNPNTPMVEVTTTEREVEKIYGPRTQNITEGGVVTKFVDTNYIDAYELLKRGMPVLYVCVSIA